MSGRRRCIAVIDPVGAVLDVVSGSDVDALVMTVPEPGRLLAAPHEIGNAIDLVVFATYGPLDWRAVRCATDRWNTMVVATRYDRSEALQALSRGLVGYIDGSDAPGALRRSIRGVLGGHLGFHREALAAWLRENGEPAGAKAHRLLTLRQRAVMALVARGRSDDEIAGTLAINPTTVRAHIRRAIERLESGSDPRAWVPDPPAAGALRRVPLAARWAAGLLLVATLSAALAGPASAGSLPNEALYSVKLAREAVEVMFASAPEDRTVVELSIASSRLDEARQLAERGSAQLALETTGRYVEHLAAAAASAVTAEREHAASMPTITRLTEQLAQKQVEVRATATGLQADPATESAGGVLAAVTASPLPQAGRSIALRLAEIATTTATHLAEGTQETAPEVSRQARRAEKVAYAAAVTAATSLIGSLANSTSTISEPANDRSAPPAVAVGTPNPGGSNARVPRSTRSTGPQHTLEPVRTAEPASTAGAAPVASPAVTAAPAASTTPSSAPAPAASATPSPAPTAVQTPTPSPSAVPGQSPAPSATPTATATIDPSTILPPLPSATPLLQKTR